MKNFLQLCSETEKKLGRKLQPNEVDFLQWVLDRYTEEERKDKYIS